MKEYIFTRGMKLTAIIHYHEINLKGNNRGWFENRLHKNIAAVLRDVRHGAIQRFAGRLAIDIPEDASQDEIGAIVFRLQKVFGVANFTVAREVPADIEAIKISLAEMVNATRFESFKIDTRRGTKEFPLNSQELNQLLGAYVVSVVL